MPTSRHWSIASAPCRLEWRPSRLLAASLLTLGLLAAAAILASEAAVVAAWPAALVAFGHGVWLARRELLKPAHAVMIPGRDRAPMLHGVAVTDFGVQWRGPLASLRWRDAQGARRRMHVWPDTLPARDRRELRLAMIGRAGAPAAGSMAP